MKDIQHPLVIIGLPVYNEETHLESCLDSIFAQDYPNYLLCISDNCSTDRTGAICRSYRKHHENLIYAQTPRKLGAPGNFRKAFAMAEPWHPKYFVFCKGKARLSPDFLSECIRILEHSPGTALAFPRFEWADERGAPIRAKAEGFYDTRGCDPAARVIFSIWGRMDYIYGVIRFEVLKNIRFDLEVIGNDQIALFELALAGPFAHAPNAAFRKIYTYANESYAKRIARYKSSTFLEMGRFNRSFPMAGLPLQLMYAVLRSKLSFMDKLLLFLVLFTHLPLKYLVKRLHFNP